MGGVYKLFLRAERRVEEDGNSTNRSRRERGVSRSSYCSFGFPDGPGGSAIRQRSWFAF